MVKIIGPALSLDGSGTLKNTMTFQGRPGGTVLTRYHKPGSRTPSHASEAQLAQRGRVAEAVEAWQALTPEQKAEYD